MYNISKATLERLRKEYPAGARVELVHMNDPYNTKLFPGARGTVVSVDDIGTIHVRWDCGSSLGIVYGEDACRKLDSVTIVYDGETKTWDRKIDAIRFYKQKAETTTGEEQSKYKKILFEIIDGMEFPSDSET